MKENTVNKKAKLAYAKSIDAKKKTVTAYVSTYEWDRTQEKFSPGAWDLENYKKNPVVLWGHDGSKPPIGRAIEIREDELGLLAVAEFDTASTLGAEIFALFERGFLNAFSVGFLPKAHAMEPLPDQSSKGVVWTEAELLEFSAVSIPANPGAVIGRDLAEMAIKSLGEGAVSKSLDGDTFVVNAVELAVAAETPPVEKLEASLNALITLARVVKGQPLDKSKMALIGTATATLNEIVAENEAPTAAEIETLHEVVKELGGVVKSMNPDSEAIVEKVLASVAKAIQEQARI